MIAADPDDPNFRSLIESAGKELKRRFDEDPASLPGTFIIKLYLDGQKAIASKAVPDAAQEESRLPLLDRIHALPQEHARGLLQGEIERLEELVASYYAALEEL